MKHNMEANHTEKQEIMSVESLISYLNANEDDVRDCFPEMKPTKRAYKELLSVMRSAPELLEELILTKNALRYLIQEARYRAGVPKGILQTAEYHAEKADAVIAKAEGRD